MSAANDNNGNGMHKMLVQMDAGELRALIRDEVERALSDRDRDKPGRWVDVTTAAEHCGVTPQTLRAWIIKAGAPARDVGTPAHPSYRVNLEEFDAWARERKPGAAR